MYIKLIQQITSGKAYCFDSIVIKEQADTLAVLYAEGPLSAQQGARSANGVNVLALVNMQQNQTDQTIVYSSSGPDNYGCFDALLCYDATHNRWLIVQDQGAEYAAIRSVTKDADGSWNLSPLCLLDRVEADDKGLFPPLAVEVRPDGYRIFYHKPSAYEHPNAPIVTALDLVLHQPEWNTLVEHASVVLSETRGSLQQWQRVIEQRRASGNQRLIDDILLPQQVIFDPGTTHAGQITALEIVKRHEIAASELAVTFASEQTRLLVLCCPDNWIDSVPGLRPTGVASPADWRIWLTGWERSSLIQQWVYTAPISLPADPSVPSHEYPIPPIVDVDVISGPATSAGKPTFVAALAMQGEEDGASLQSHGVCLDHDGQVVQVCENALGRYPSLCCCGEMIVGVDREGEAWRLWNWAVLDEGRLDRSLNLAAECQRAFVRAFPDGERFWLIEELPQGVRVSLRSAETLHELEPAAEVAGVHFLPADQDRALNGYRNVGLIPYQKTLLLLVLDGQERLLLYQAQGE